MGSAVEESIREQGIWSKVEHLFDHQIPMITTSFATARETLTNPEVQAKWTRLQAIGAKALPGLGKVASYLRASTLKIGTVVARGLHRVGTTLKNLSVGVGPILAAGKATLAAPVAAFVAAPIVVQVAIIAVAIGITVLLVKRRHVIKARLWAGMRAIKTGLGWGGPRTTELRATPTITPCRARVRSRVNVGRR
jgi:hypothetical protein